jgi:hypothetical protein
MLAHPRVAGGIRVLVLVDARNSLTILPTFGSACVRSLRGDADVQVVAMPQTRSKGDTTGHGSNIALAPGDRKVTISTAATFRWPEKEMSDDPRKRIRGDPQGRGPTRSNWLQRSTNSTARCRVRRLRPVGSTTSPPPPSRPPGRTPDEARPGHARSTPAPRSGSRNTVPAPGPAWPARRCDRARRAWP